MLGAFRDTDITFASRFECKYRLDPVVVPGIRDFLASFAAPDRFAAMREGYRYPISSLYLDSDDLRLYQQVVGGDKKRFKLRARCYSDRPGAPVFLEVKRKVDGMVRKRRVRLSRDHAVGVLAGAATSLAAALPPELRPDLDYFEAHLGLVSARPLIKVRYLREAYESRGGDPVRITMDTELCHAVALDGDVSHARGPWIPVPLAETILEIKFTERYPSWVHDLVRLFGLKQVSVPKYVMCVDHLLGRGRAATLSLAGFLLPTAGR